MSEPTPILELRGITKTFGDKVANEDISLSFLPGRVHAIVGENGAGKTTLVNMISGNLQPDLGTIFFEGAEATVENPNRADELGIGMVHQHFKLVPSLTVAANIFLGKELTTGMGRLDQKGMQSKVRELAERFGLAIDPDDRVEDLSVGERQRVEILKALSHDTRLLILDEPTAVLTPAEAGELFIVVRQLAERGCAIVFISHKLGEVLAIADDISVIRDGRVVGTQPAAGLTQTDIATMMVGRDVLLRIKHTPADPRDEVLSVEDLSAVDARGIIALKGVSLSIRRGEVVGIAGVEGNGQSELTSAIAGMIDVPRGTIRISGTDVTRATVAKRREIGLAYVPEDRHEEGAGPGLSIAENIAATKLRAPLVRFGWLSLAKMRELSQKLIAMFDVRGATPTTKIGELSGGNMQKVIIAREFTSDPELLVISQPTRGVDVGAMEFVHNSIVAARDRGAGVLLVSADLGEVMSLSDRLLVMFRGEFIAEFTQDNMSETAVGLAMAGTRPTPEALAEAVAEHARVADELGLDTSAVSLVDASAESATVTESVRVAAPEFDTSAISIRDSREPRGQFFASFASRAFESAKQPVIAVLVALVIGVFVILAIGKNPFEAYVALFTSGWRESFGISNIVATFIPLAVISAATIVSFRAGFFNIGAEGQLYFGAFFGAIAGVASNGLPPFTVMLIVMVVGSLAGAAWGLLPGWLFAYWRVNIIVTTLLLSEVAKLVTRYLVTGPFKDPTAGYEASEKLPEGVQFTMFSPEYGIGPDLILALLAAVGIALLLGRTRWGLKVKQLGEMSRFAQYTGVSVKAMSIQVMMLSGAVAGFTGALLVLGPNGDRFIQAFSPGYGFLAITVALLARLNPWASLVAALFYATMMAGSTGLQEIDVPFPVVNVLQGIIIIAITATFVWNRKKKRVAVPASVVTERGAA
ncbi:ATP-binding cassette domain-containing protein [Leucobacter luti]|uniref:ATP-binding cassette domain-containing protein n=1 Tax=Leucobacter luti TaxID=340320 RepID=UPI001C6907A6|nr:ATP-binding cassette domain-containing protein [Leucobacter luti]QYM75875.1 ATP-binding cassette domain-containing protein [Leucobacter luti]